MRNLLGGKGANLCEMAEIGLNVPPGFIVSTEVCKKFYKNKQTLPPELEPQMLEALEGLETNLGKKFGDVDNPLLVSVRSGARVSMPGMMDTVLNLGLNDKTLLGLAKVSSNKRFALDSYRRFIHMYGNVVLNIPHYKFENLIEECKQKYNKNLDTDLQEIHLIELVEKYKKLVAQDSLPFPQNPIEQLKQAIAAVFKSWLSPRAKTYRKLNNIPEAWGTAVTIQAMAFGNMGEDCLTGVAFTRNPSNGEDYLYGEFLLNAQGEDVVSGIRTPQPISEQAKKQSHIERNSAHSSMPEVVSLEKSKPKIFAELMAVRSILEKHYRDMQDIEFTVEKNKLFLLQTRAGKRTAQAAVRIACDMLERKQITQEEALMHIEPQSLNQLLHARLDPKATKKLLTRALPASPGAACGVIVFSANDAEDKARNGQDVLLVRTETSPEDIHGMHAAKGILTARGGMTSHAAVVARGMGRACVCGASELVIDLENKELHVRGVTLKEGDAISIDGAKGEVYIGKVDMILPELDKYFHTMMTWCDKARRMDVRANADTEEDAKLARSFGAQGIGLCRTEHMFFEGERITDMRAMILAQTSLEREAALAKLLPMQRQDFVKIFKVMDNLPVTIRLLDPPLHEFLPHSDADLKALVESLKPELKLSLAEAKARTARLKESNPMLGHRGARLLATYPEICRMQARAIFEAIIIARESGGNPICEIMIPLIATKEEFDNLSAIVKTCAEKVRKEKKCQKIEYKIGTMVELPRAALIADEIAESAEFFSFGTNDLTQTVWGISRDDAGSFLQEYERLGFIPHDPFTTIDRRGVGAMIELAVNKGRKTRADIKLGICGEHGGDPRSIAFCEEQGLDYVSCSPYRIAIARLAAAQAAIVINKARKGIAESNKLHKKTPQQQSA